VELRIVHDLLDKVVLDDGRRNIGRVDGVVLELRRGGAPVVSAFEIGGRVLARRLGPRFARWAVALGKRWPALGNGVTRFAMRDVRTTGITRAGGVWSVQMLTTPPDALPYSADDAPRSTSIRLTSLRSRLVSWPWPSGKVCGMPSSSTLRPRTPNAERAPNPRIESC